MGEAARIAPSPRCGPFTARKTTSKAPPVRREVMATLQPLLGSSFAYDQAVLEYGLPLSGFYFESKTSRPARVKALARTAPTAPAPAIASA